MNSPTSKTLLLVEDSDDDRVLFERALRKAEFQNPIATVRTGVEAAMYLRAEGRFSSRAEFPFPSVMFLDLRLPGVSGFDTLEAVRVAYPPQQLIVVVLTGSDDLPAARKAYALGADYFLVKPPEPLDFLNLKTAFPGRF